MRRGPWIVRPADRRHARPARGLLRRARARPEPADVPRLRRRLRLRRGLDRRTTRVWSRTTARGSSPSTSSSPCSGCRSNSIVVRTTVGVPAPSVGRVERMDCAYSGTAPAGPRQRQARCSRSTRPPTRRPPPPARSGCSTPRARTARTATSRSAAPPGVLVERPGETLLAVQYGSGTVTLVLPDRPLPAGSTPDGHARRPRAAGAADDGGRSARSPPPRAVPHRAAGPVRAMR